MRRPKLPDLSKYTDISEYITGGGGASDSEADDLEDSKVEIQAGQKAIQVCGCGCWCGWVCPDAP